MTVLAFARTDTPTVTTTDTVRTASRRMAEAGVDSVVVVSVGSADEASVGSADEASVGSADEASVGSADEASVGSADEVSAGSADEARDERRVAGVIEDRDVVRLVRAGGDPATTAATAIDCRVETISAEAGVFEAVRRLDETGARCLPVVADGELRGVVTPSDIVVLLAEEIGEVAGSVEFDPDELLASEHIDIDADAGTDADADHATNNR